MRILFINRGNINLISGGYIYNSKIISYGTELGYEITYSDRLIEGFDLHVVDSLMLNESNLFRQEYLNKTVVLVHQFPAKNQSVIDRQLSIDDRNKLKYIVTGELVENALLEEWKINPESIRQVTPGIEDTWRSKQTSRSNVSSLIMVANYLPNKGYENLLDLIPMLYELDLTLDCYGSKSLDIDFHKELIDNIKLLDPDERVQLHGTISRSELNDKYISADLLISLSESESYGMAIYEAICSNLHVLMFKTGQWQEFSNSEFTSIVENGDINAFAEKLKSIKKEERPLSFSTIKKGEERTWDIACNEFYNHLQNWFVS